MKPPLWFSKYQTPALRAASMLRQDGAEVLAKRVLRTTYRRFGDPELEFPLLPGDVADSSRLRLAPPPPHIDVDRPLNIGWLTSPPSVGSGGHTTTLRMIEGLEKAGHTCRIMLYDRFGGDPAHHAAVIRTGWPNVRAEVCAVGTDFADLDVCIATSWSTAHVLASRCKTPMRCCHFVQDFEPFFYPHGSEYALAEDSYRLGFRCITIGPWIAEVLRTEVGVESDVVEFGCDTDVYQLTNRGFRSGVVFYAKPGVPRRGYLLGRYALEEFHGRHPEQEIHVFGGTSGSFSFPVTNHGTLRPAQLNELYNKTIAGFAISFTNISLVAEEMLAAGTIPLINDSPYPRTVLQNPYARWAMATPGSMADALCELVEGDAIADRAVAASASVRQASWASAQAMFVSAIEDEAFGHPRR